MSYPNGKQADFAARAAALKERLHAVQLRIEKACASAGRPPDSVRLLAVSKTCPAAAVHTAWAAGQTAFGENYVQEGVDKIAALDALLRDEVAKAVPGVMPSAMPDAIPQVMPLSSAPTGNKHTTMPEWHFIGPLQTNKTRVVAEHFAWVHGVDRLKIAERLSSQRPATLPPLNVCIQINIDGGANKSGVAPAEATALALAIAALPNLRLRGLMSIPEPAVGLAAQRAPHRALKELFDQLNRSGMLALDTWLGTTLGTALDTPLDTLSIGMSGDLEAAILEGATMVRIGTAIFGERH